MNLFRYFIILFIFILTAEVNTYRILGVFPVAFKSHNIFFEALMKVLAKRGHKVDIITHYELSNPPENYTTILNLPTLNFPYPESQFISIENLMKILVHPIRTICEIYGNNMCKLLGHQKVQDFIMNPPKDPAYDLVIVEGLTFSCFYGLGHLWNVPVVTITPSLEFPWISKQIGNPLSTAFFPTFMMQQARVETFWDRLQNTVISYLSIYNYFDITDKPQTELMRKFLSPNMPSIREIERSVALSLVNTHHTLHGIRPTTPAFIEVGGLHIEEDNSTFTMELKQWMDESKNGVVYVSTGTIIPLESLPKKTMLSIYSSFSKLAPTRVLIKASDGHKFPPGLPTNVLTMKWIPQIPVLRHNNTRAFISHCGLHSVEESVYYGIPLIGIPFLYDQLQNAEIIVNKKMGIRLNLDKITEKSLNEALGAVLNNPKYREAARNYSRLFRDRPMSPGDTAAYWIEYVIRNGAQSLRSPGVDLYWWQLEVLDVYGLLLFCLVLVFYVIIIIVKTIVKQCFWKKVKPELKRD